MLKNTTTFSLLPSVSFKLKAHWTHALLLFVRRILRYWAWTIIFLTFFDRIEVQCHCVAVITQWFLLSIAIGRLYSWKSVASSFINHLNSKREESFAVKINYCNQRRKLSITIITKKKDKLSLAWKTVWEMYSYKEGRGLSGLF